MVGIRTYLDARLADRGQMFRAEMESVRGETGHLRTAVELVQSELQRQVTELHEESREFITADDYERRHEALTQRIAALERWQANIVGRGIGLALVGALFVAAFSAIVAHLLA